MSVPIVSHIAKKKSTWKPYGLGALPVDKSFIAAYNSKMVMGVVRALFMANETFLGTCSHTYSFTLRHLALSPCEAKSSWKYEFAYITISLFDEYFNPSWSLKSCMGVLDKAALTLVKESPAMWPSIWAHFANERIVGPFYISLFFLHEFLGGCV